MIRLKEILRSVRKVFMYRKLSEEEEIFKNLLFNYIDFSSKDEWDLGKTHLTWHKLESIVR